MSKVVMEVKNIKKEFYFSKGWFKKNKIVAVNDVSFKIEEGKTYGLVGESGCGKSTLASTILMLTKPTSGEIIYDNKIVDLKQKNVKKKMRKELQLIFQDPYASIDPKMKIKDIIIEPMRTHKLYKTKKECYDKAEELLKIVGLNKDTMDRYPHEFSGGQRQRISIARVLGVNPKLIIADEATAALDVSIQAQILNLLKGLQKKLNLTMIFISHDLNVVQHISNEIIVMFLGNIVEIGDKNLVYNNPLHPYTKALISAAPSPDPFEKKKRITLKGELPSLFDLPSGCLMHPRCPFAIEICKKEKPILRNVEANREVACHLYPNKV